MTPEEIKAHIELCLNNILEEDNPLEAYEEYVFELKAQPGDYGYTVEDLEAYIKDSVSIYHTRVKELIK